MSDVLEDLEIRFEDFGAMTWYEANEVCKRTGNGWRLPTLQELELMYEHKDSIGEFIRKPYWTSSEDKLFAWAISFDGGTQALGRKRNTHYVRIVKKRF